MTVSTTSTGSTWNGGVCPTCGSRFLGSHTCSSEDIVRRIGELTRALEGLKPLTLDRACSCACRQENGGSGVCGCILGGPRVTC